MKTIIKIPKSDFDPYKTLLGGQSFLWNIVDNDVFVGEHTDFILFLEPNGKYFHVKTYILDEFNTKISHENIKDYIIRYFRQDVLYKNEVNKVKMLGSAVMEAATELYGLNVIRQPLWETSATFILSSNNSIKNIRSSVNKLKKILGRKVVTDYGEFYLFPSPHEINSASEKLLKKASIGYRYKYIKDLARNFDLIEKNLKNNDSDIIEILKSINGIGDKVADCIAVFSGLRDDITPVDVWAKRIMYEKFGIRFSKYDMYRKWFADNFKNSAYLAGQFLFEYYRK